MRKLRADMPLRWRDKETGLSFRSWLRQQSYRDDPVGDLSGDMLADETCPVTDNLAVLQSHLMSQGACEGALDALDEAHLQWRRYRRPTVGFCDACGCPGHTQHRVPRLPRTPKGRRKAISREIQRKSPRLTNLMEQQRTVTTDEN